MVVTNQMPQTPGLYVNSKGSLKNVEVWLISFSTLQYLENPKFTKLNFKYECFNVSKVN